MFVSCSDSQFLESHWNHPISAQGTPPSDFPALERNLNPKSCGTCHQNQFQNWEKSFHAKSISPGFLWQKEIFTKEEYKSCLNCHSPLAETKSEIDSNFQTPEIISSKSHNFPDGIDNPSILCASCHIRNQIRFGPPPKINKKIEQNSGRIPHNSYVVKEKFESSEFCKSCHESKETGVRLNGKRLMEVYTEWEGSSYAKDGIQCQNCHMPDREHSWKGIHDKDFVQNSLEPKWEVKKNNGVYQIKAELKNRGVGHNFPTYLVPKVYLRFFASLKSQNSRILLEESIVGRVVNTNLTEEYLDTRIKPNDSYKISFDYKPNENLVTELIWEIEVDPDEQYVRSFEEELKNRAGTLSYHSKKQLQESLYEKKNSRYILFTLSWKVPVSLRQ
ncbi:cytochrome c554 and C-prime [Leptospira noumeaensis]|uniref:Cytochrome c554 and C-prime n=1 Tax=Leptospira noumeaensis TaxID=2484964 RepID=A0A4R9I1H7_9LEPT|nr:cytochrome c554 and C-prime [Leptospira noumeaensis]